MKIGDTIWRFDPNRRVYRKPEPGKILSDDGPIWREHWMETKITGETSRSWIIGKGYCEYKVPKKGDHRGYAFTQQEVDDECYVNEHLYKIARQVEFIRDAGLLRKIAELIGYKL